MGTAETPTGRRLGRPRLVWLGIVAVTIAGVAAAVGRRFLPERVVLLGWELFWVAVYVWVWGG